MPKRATRLENASAVGRGWRPGPPGCDNSLSRSTKMAPGMWPWSYFSRPLGQRRSTIRTSGCFESHSAETSILSTLVGNETAEHALLEYREDTRRDRKVIVERLLVVDDELPILHVLQRTLEAAGYQVTACNDPHKALELLKQQPYQVLSADYMMPGMSGAEFLARARVIQPETLRILVTAANDFSAAVAAVNDGEIFRILAKPWNRVELLSCVRQALDTHALREHNRQLASIVQSQNEELAALNKGL